MSLSKKLIIRPTLGLEGFHGSGSLCSKVQIPFTGRLIVRPDLGLDGVRATIIYLLSLNFFYYVAHSPARSFVGSQNFIKHTIASPLP